jgi:hypothetical protein
VPGSQRNDVALLAFTFNDRQHIVCEAICSSTFSAKRSVFVLLDATRRRWASGRFEALKDAGD